MRREQRDTWREADRILDTLLDVPAAQREQRLADVRMSDTVRGKVRRLLTAHGSTGPLAQALPLPAHIATWSSIVISSHPTYWSITMAMCACLTSVSPV